VPRTDSEALVCYGLDVDAPADGLQQRPQAMDSLMRAQGAAEERQAPGIGAGAVAKAPPAGNLARQQRLLPKEA
jgi:hypothetical protein